MLFVALPLLLLVFFSSSLIFVGVITVCLGAFLEFILPRTLCFLDLGDCFLSCIREVFSYCLLKYFLKSILSSPSGTPPSGYLTC